MPLFPDTTQECLYLSMDDESELLSRCSPHVFSLEQLQWPSVEHYFQAMQFEDSKHREKIRNAKTTSEAAKLGRSWFKKKRQDLEMVKTTLMTRAVYTKCRTHTEVAERLILTGDIKLVENSQYDYFWGCGRDHRGDNHYGQVLMNVREKLNSEALQKR